MTLTLQTHRTPAAIEAEIDEIERQYPRIYVGSCIDWDDADRTRQRFAKVGLYLQVLANAQMYAWQPRIREQLQALRHELMGAEMAERVAAATAHRDRDAATERTMAALPTIHGAPVQYCATCDVADATDAHFAEPAHRARRAS